MGKSIEALPGTELRSLAICAMAASGLAGPNYNLDDVSALVMRNNDYIHVSFWDMNKFIREDNEWYEKLSKELELQGG